jgi:DNA-binding transcriptional LysR family regulator
MEPIALESLTGIAAFARVATLGSYNAAARSLAISPSAVSKSVQRLEERLGVRLLSRTTRSVTLTTEGRDVHDRALRLLREADEIGQIALAARAEPAGVVKVTAPLPVGIHILAPHLPSFRQRYPKLSVDLRLSDTFADLVEEGIDVAIRVGPTMDSRLMSRKLAPNRVCAFASPAYLERRGTPQRPEDLNAHDCINVRPKSSGQAMRWPFQLGDHLLEILPDAGIVVDNTDAVVSMLVNGGGIGISPTYVAVPHVARGELVPVLPNYWADRNDIVALWPEGDAVVRM